MSILPDVRTELRNPASSVAAEVVRVAGLAKLYKRRRALSDVSLSVRRGEIFGLVGPDGAGKSSLIKSIAGVLTFDAGSVEVFGVSLTSEAQAERVKPFLGFMPQGLGLNLYPDLSIDENIDYFARLRGVSGDRLESRKRRLLDMTRLDPFRRRAMRFLSGGMKQKLGLICTLIHEPELIILDEPTTGVDPVSRRDFWTILSELLAEGRATAIVSTAYLDEASRFDRLALLYGGRLVAQGEPEAVRGSVAGSLVTVRTDRQKEALKRIGDALGFPEAVGEEIRVFVPDLASGAAEQSVRKSLVGLPVAEVCAGEPELDDVFVELLKRRGIGAPRTVESVAREESSHIESGAGPAIEARELTRDFGNFRAVDGVSFRVARGEIFGLLGANGAGKTTVIKMLTGILPPTSGGGRIAGSEVGTGGADIKRRIGYVSQAFSLYQDLTVLENLRLYAGIYGLGPAESREQIHGLLHRGGLVGHENDLSGSLPMGLRQRLALGCALIHRPRVLFLDEPTSGVDPIGRRAFWDVLFDLSRGQGVTVLVTTHYMAEAAHCDHLALMYAGRVVADASPREMKAQVEREAGVLLEISGRRPGSMARALSKAGFAGAALFGRRVHLFSRNPRRDSGAIQAILESAECPAESIAGVPLTMEDVFVYRVSRLESRADPMEESRP